MKKNYLLFILCIIFYGVSHAQCNPLPVSVATSFFCQENSYVIVDSSNIIELSIKDTNNNKLPAIWSPTTDLWTDATMTTPYTGSIATEVFFNGNSPYNFDSYQANYPLSGCTQFVISTIDIYSDGLTYKTCNNTQETVADITFLNYTNSQISFYTDTAGTVVAPPSIPLNFNDMLYVSFGSNCGLIPLKIESEVAVPEVEPIEKFCSQATWQAAGISNAGDDLTDVSVFGENITWYSDAAGTQVISDPSTITLTDNDTFYVSQTVNGCDSGLVSVNMLETSCGCIENGEIEASGNNTADNDYAFHTENYTTINACNFAFDYTTTSNLFTGTLGTNDDPNAKISLTHPGFIMAASNHGVNIDKTSPFSNSKNAIRINDYDINLGTFNAARTGGTLVKKFIAGEVLTFDYMLMLNHSSAGHQYDDLQSLTLRMYDNSGNIVITDCIVLDGYDCVLSSFQVPSSMFDIFYTDWSCLKVDTQAYQGQGLTLELTMTDCAFAGHWATGYFDNFYVGDDGPDVCSSPLYGEMFIEPITQTGGSFENCSLVSENNVNNGCTTFEKLINPTFPLEVCFNYQLPPSSGSPFSLDDVILNFYSEDYGYTVFSTSSVYFSSPEVLCVTVNESDIPAIGSYSIYAEIQYSTGCNSFPGVGYLNSENIDAFKVCPVASCPTDMIACTMSSSTTFDLTTKDTEILVNIPTIDQGDYMINYFTDEIGAMNNDQSFLISNPINYMPQSLPASVFARLDYNYSALGINPISDCYDLVEIILDESSVISQIPSQVSDLVYCEEATGPPMVDLTIKESEIFNGLNMADYTWSFHETLQDASSQSNPIAGPAQYSLLQPTQDIFVNVEHANGCSATVQFIVKKHDMFSIPTPIEVKVCDDDGTLDGYYQFDLSIPTAQIIVNYPTVSVSYYATQVDAEAEANPFSNLYTNTTAYNEIIYARLYDGVVGCENIVPVNLIIDVSELLAAINPIPTDQESNVTMNASGSNLEVDLSWESGSNYCIDDEMFDVMMGTSPSQLNLVQADITTTTFTVQVNANTTYYWQVIPKNSQTTLGNTAPVWEFTTQSLSTDSEVFSNLVYYTKNNQFYVKTSGNTIEQLTIFNLHGKRIMSFSGNQSSEMVVDLAQLSSSVYLVQIKVEGYYKTVKLIKQ